MAASFRWSRIVEMFTRARLYSSSNKEKWIYSHQEIIDIVEHMQSLSLLKHEGDLSSSDTEQVRYLKSAMKIAETLRDVDTSSVMPFHNPAQFMLNNQFRQDTVTTDGSNFVKDSSNVDKSTNLISAPSISY